ncbi:MAG: glycosyltransferase family 2 protein [Desulfobacteraceae bacterium]|nr:MAG: glycosyltransferase family 2 protein [Desulfobacteraceae bacterium]
MDLSVIIVNWNTKDLLRECLASIHHHWKHICHEVIVIDNASADGSSEMLKNEFRDVGLIQNLENQGFAKANNQGALLAGGRYLLLLNSDTKVLDSEVDKIIDYMDQHPEVGIASGRVLNADFSAQNSFRRFPHPLGAFFRHTTRLVVGFNTPFHKKFQLAHIDKNRIAEVDWVTGAYMFIRKNVLENEKPFDDDMDMYYEDTLLCHTASQKGYRIVFLPYAGIIHYGGASAKTIRSSAILKSCKSSVTYFRKTYGNRYSDIYRQGVKMAWLALTILFYFMEWIPFQSFKQKASLFQELFQRRNEI